MKRDELLLWLNDRLGKSVHVSVVVERDDLDVTVLETDGKLRFWRQDIHAPVHLAREDLSGCYQVGIATIDVGHLGRARARKHPDLPQVDLDLADGVRLVIVERV